LSIAVPLQSLSEKLGTARPASIKTPSRDSEDNLLGQIDEGAQARGHVAACAWRKTDQDSKRF
jgi:hypothetical protein